MTASVKVNLRRYGRLLAATVPGVVKTEKENERLLAEVEKLMRKKSLSPEEEKLLDLLVTLIEDFEGKHYQLNASTPHGILKELMEARGVKASDLWKLFGSKGVTSEVINGKRAISKAQAKALAEYFNVPADLFI
ncbi:MAG TPA: transcriptional regulator [Blastocatellia bacterium]